MTWSTGLTGRRISNNSVTLTDQSGNGLPRALVFHSDAYLSNFALGSDASSTGSIGNIASHEINFRKPDGTKIATTRYMASDLREHETVYQGDIGAIAFLGLQFVTPASAEVTWMDLLEAPDDIALNQRFISERVEAGDVPAALSAVERLINLRPADIQLRPLRAELLVSLGNDTLAIGEIEALAQLPMAPEQSARVNEPPVIESRAQRWRTIVSTSIGLSGSDNANSYPSSGLLEFRPTGATENSTSTYETFGGAEKTIREVATTASVSVAATYEFANQDRDSATIGAAHNMSRGRKYEYLTNSSSTVCLPGPASV